MRTTLNLLRKPYPPTAAVNQECHRVANLKHDSQMVENKDAVDTLYMGLTAGGIPRPRNSGPCIFGLRLLFKGICSNSRLFVLEYVNWVSFFDAMKITQHTWGVEFTTQRERVYST